MSSSPVTSGTPSQAAPSSAAQAKLLAVFAKSGAKRSEPAVLQPAHVFVDLAGEDIRRRMLTTVDAAGTERCLRPDFTIPVALDYLAAQRTRAERYCYLGPVFRQRDGHAHEVLQAGVEDFGSADLAATDADILLVAIRSLATLGRDQLTIRIGDKALFSGLVAHLPLADWHRRRLLIAYGDRAALARTLVAMAKPTDDLCGPLAESGSGLDVQDDERFRRLARDMVASASAGGFVGRSADEIVDRLMMRRDLKLRANETRAAVDPLRKLLAISGAGDVARNQIRQLADTELPALKSAARLFEKRLSHLEAGGIPSANLNFEASFGRPLDYYTGFEFEIYDAATRERLVGGGRYDHLCSRLGSASPVSAVGFTIWLTNVDLKT